MGEIGTGCAFKWLFARFKHIKEAPDSVLKEMRAWITPHL